jgi:hypothetical protein
MSAAPLHCLVHRVHFCRHVTWSRSASEFYTVCIAARRAPLVPTRQPGHSLRAAHRRGKGSAHLVSAPLIPERLPERTLKRAEHEKYLTARKGGDEFFVG